MTGYLAVRNWDKFQHYKDRRPPWIKYHVALLDDYELMSAPPMVQLVYDRMLLLAAITDNTIPADAAWIARRVHLPAKRVQAAIRALVESEHLASTVLPLARSRETEAEAEAEKETEKPQAVPRGQANGPQEITTGEIPVPTLRAMP